MQASKRHLMKATLLLVAGIFLLNTIANFLYWYTAISWFDMMMHTLGGIFLGLGGAALFFRAFENRTPFYVLSFLLLIVFIFGLGWEGYEYAVQYFVKHAQLATFWDSLSDLAFDLAGGGIATLFVLIEKKRYNVINVD